ncbi:MAG TPA: hypothetical protein VFV78_08615 [Vicinamibacterales bacterium]|nr:hypothetical protein [Vicinamibacterales bacterium]
MFSQASLEHAVSKSVGTLPNTPRASKSFWKGPWPWVIGAAAAVLIVVAASGSNGTGIY